MSTIVAIRRRGLSVLVVVVLVALALPLFFNAPAMAQLANTAWPQVAHDPQHTSRSPYVGPTEKHIKWSLPVNRSITTSPALAGDGTIYFGTQSNGPDEPPAFYAVNPDGSVKWSKAMDADVDASPAIGDEGVVYTAAGDSKVYAFNPDGTVQWVFDAVTNGIGGGVYSGLTIAADGTIYFGSMNGHLYAVNPDGTLKWAFNTGTFIQWSSPALAYDGTIYITSTNGRLWAVNPDGSQKWVYDTGAVTRSTPSVDTDGTIYIGTDAATNTSHASVIALNPNGSQKWKYTLAEFHDNIRSNVAIASDGTLHFGTMGAGGKLYSLNSDGTFKWSYSTGSIVNGAAPLVDAEGKVYVSTSNPTTPINATYAFDADGALLWTHENSANSVNIPAMDPQGTVYTAAHDKLTAFSVDPVPDTIPPIVTGIPDREPNENGWYDADVTITWVATDPDSGITPTQPPAIVASSEGEDTLYTSEPSCDLAGNCTTGSLALSIDRTAPTVTSVQPASFIKPRNQAISLTAVMADNLSPYGGEFFVDANPGAGNGEPMDLSGTTLTGTITTSQPGFHLIGVRSQDSAGNWSPVRYTFILVF